MRIVASGVLLGSHFARVVLGRVAIETLAGVGKVGADLRGAILAHLLLLVTAVGGIGDGGVSALVEMVRVHGWCHSVSHVGRESAWATRHEMAGPVG